MSINQLTDMAIKGKRVLIREDLNVPIAQGKVTSDARLRAAMPTLRHAVHAGARVLLMSHLGRPEAGLAIAEQPEFSLAPVATRLAELSGLKVRLIADYLNGFEAQGEDISLLENVRLNRGETTNDAALAQQLGKLCDLFVMDAFGTAHRAHASTEGVIRCAPLACAGPLLSRELKHLKAALKNPERPMVAVIGGSKVSTKLAVLQALSKQVDAIIVGGGIANTFLAATGVATGNSLIEPELLGLAKALLDAVVLPEDVLVAQSISQDARGTVKSLDAIAPDDMIVDLGPKSINAMCKLLTNAKTILWNGPLGVAEIPQFATGTETLARSIAASSAWSLAGGGDTLAVIDQLNIAEHISYVSTGGGAFLEFVEGKTLPSVAALEARYAYQEERKKSI